MVEIEFSKKPKEQRDNQSDLDDDEINLGGEILCALQEVKRLKNQISSQESSITIFQIELNDSKRLVGNLKSILDDKENVVKTLEQQNVSLKKKIEGFESTIQLNDILGKQKINKDMNGVVFNVGECLNQNSKPIYKK
jgi:chromosome segregation ATPase